MPCAPTRAPFLCTQPAILCTHSVHPTCHSVRPPCAPNLPFCAPSLCTLSVHTLPFLQCTACSHLPLPVLTEQAVASPDGAHNPTLRSTQHRQQEGRAGRSVSGCMIWGVDSTHTYLSMRSAPERHNPDHQPHRISTHAKISPHFPSSFPTLLPTPPSHHDAARVDADADAQRPTQGVDHTTGGL